MWRAALFGLLASAGTVAAQEPAPATGADGLGQIALGQVTTSQVLTLDQDKLFSASLFGQRVAREIETASRELAAENRKIEAELAAEELDLTSRRPTLPPTEFRVLADDFDARVVDFRRTQDEKLRALNKVTEIEKQRFYQAALPVLADMVAQAGAAVILDSRVVFLALDRIDITAEATQRIDAALGDGAAPPADTPGTGPAPDN